MTASSTSSIIVQPIYHMIFIPHQLPQQSMYAQYSTLEVDTASATSSTSCPPVFQGEISPPTHMTEEERRMWAKDRQKKDNHNMSECFQGDIFIHPTKVSTEHSWVLLLFFFSSCCQGGNYMPYMFLQNHYWERTTRWVFRELYMPQKEIKIYSPLSTSGFSFSHPFISSRFEGENYMPYMFLQSHYWERCFCPFISSCWDIL